MIVDFHTHILPERFRSDRASIAAKDETFAEMFSDPDSRIAGAEELIESMRAAGIDRSIALGYGWSDLDVAREANDYILEAAARHPDQIVPFCSVNPAWGVEAIAEARRCAEQGARGIGELHPDTQGFNPADTELLKPFMQAVRELGLIVLMHASEPVGHMYPGKGSATPDRLEALVNNFPDNKIVFAHFGGGLPFYGLMDEVRDGLANAWFDTAATPFLYNSHVYSTTARTIGPEKILFGSDFPLITQKRAMAHILGSDYPDEFRDSLLGGNAACLPGIA